MVKLHDGIIEWLHEDNKQHYVKDAVGFIISFEDMIEKKQWMELLPTGGSSLGSATNFCMKLLHLATCIPVPALIQEQVAGERFCTCDFVGLCGLPHTEQVMMRHYEVPLGKDRGRGRGTTDTSRAA